MHRAQSADLRELEQWINFSTGWNARNGEAAAVKEGMEAAACNTLAICFDELVRQAALYAPTLAKWVNRAAVIARLRKKAHESLLHRLQHRLWRAMLDVARRLFADARAWEQRYLDAQRAEDKVKSREETLMRSYERTAGARREGGEAHPN